jgi:cytochrome c553
VLTLLLAVGLVAVTSAADPDAVEVPADVTIDQLSYWFAAVEFSHGDHNDMADDCTACHHDQEPDEISACGDCHGVTYDPSEPDAPDLKMAYHQLCVGCHQEVDAPLACVDCHERRALPAGPELREAAQK